MEEQELTPAVQALVAELEQMRTALTDLQARADRLTQPIPLKPLSTAVTTTRRKTLGRLGLALLGGAATAASLGATPPSAEAKVVAHPQTNGLAN